VVLATSFAAASLSRSARRQEAGSGQPDMPIMGILSMPNIHTSWNPPCSEYVQQTYVEWLAAAGARTVKIPFTADAATLQSLLGKLSGALFTGGMLDLTATSGPQKQYVDAARVVYNYAVDQNSKGNPFVLKGTCQGFQLIAILAGQDASVLQCKNAAGTGPAYTGTMTSMLPLNLTAKWWKSRYLADIAAGAATVPKSLLSDFTTQDSTANAHNCGISNASWDGNAKLTAAFDVLSTNEDVVGKDFVSLYEHKTAEIYATQYHPEAAQFWYGLGFNKKPASLRVSTYCGDFIVSRLRRVTANKFTDDSWKSILLINSNFPIVQQPADEVTGFYCTGGYGGNGGASSEELQDEKHRAGTFAALFSVTLVLFLVTAFSICWMKKTGVINEAGWNSSREAGRFQEVPAAPGAKSAEKN
jgi:hypothetical protein